MDSYLTIAETVLRTARRPMTSREIVDAAYVLAVVPTQLYGKTQHKTLGARLSEDILIRRDRSLFFRTEPGQFFLTEFLTDSSIPEKYRSPIVARRRERELSRGRLLAISRQALSETNEGTVAEKSVLRALHESRWRYLDSPPDRAADDLLVWSFVMVVLGCEVLTYRHGRYREGRDSFLQRRSIGFFTPVADVDRDLFHQDDHGIIASGIRAVVLDLDLPRTVSCDTEYLSLAHLHEFILHSENGEPSNLLSIVVFKCPAWFEPLTRRLALNDLDWMRLDRPVNHIEDFDPWSQLVLQHEPPAAQTHP